MHRSRAFMAILGVVLAGLPGAAWASVVSNQEGVVQRAEQGVDQDPTYPVGSIIIEYLRHSDAQPAIDELMKKKVMLGRLDGRLVAPVAGAEPVAIQAEYLHEIVNDAGVTQFAASGLQSYLQGLVGVLQARDMLGVFATVDPFQIDEFGRDLREPGDTTLRIIIATGVVSEVRTVASGSRVAAEERIDHPIHDEIRLGSPIQPTGESEGDQIDLARKDALDRYIFQLSRHPGRRVDASLAAGEEPGTVALDYHITETRPFTVYAQAANTGTTQTDRWRYRFGFFHNQLTNNDDILSVDYATAGFDESHAVVASYEAPLFGNPRLRGRVYAAWSEFTASDIGFFSDTFIGKQWSIGAELSANIMQDRDLFIDLVAGLRYEDVSVDNRGFLISGDAQFLVPYIGARLERGTERYQTDGSLIFEFQGDLLSDFDEDDLEALGRTSPDEDWVVMQWNVGHSFFLEPLMDRASWEDPTSPSSSTLAHELALQFRGQYAFGDRLIPQAEEVAGGLYSVRGYPESLVAGDTVLIGTVEYRFHVPRAFAPKAEPGSFLGQPFRWSPQYVYGEPDWDLVLKAFVDVGRSYNSDRLFFEEDETLVGAGIGVDLQLMRNVNARLDWGFALEDTITGGVDAGDSRLHFVVTVLY